MSLFNSIFRFPKVFRLLPLVFAILLVAGCEKEPPPAPIGPQRPPTEFEIITKKAEEGDADSMMEMGKILEKGLHDQPMHYRKAARWYQKASEAGNIQEKNEIGRLYEIGQDLTFFRNIPEALSWYKEAANEGNTDAQVNLAWLIEHNDGTTDYDEAAKWYKKGAEAGDPLAQFRLGLLYQSGKGLIKDYFEAATWIEKAAKAGFRDAQFELARMYYEGNGKPKSASDAVKWFTEAAHQGHPDAQLQLGLIYFGGDGVPKDQVEGYRWLNIAANNHKEAKTYREMFTKDLSPDQLQMAQAKSRDFEATIKDVHSARWFDKEGTGQ